MVIAGVVVAALAIQGSWWAEEAPSASEDQKASDGSSMLTDAGFDYVNVEGVLRVRVDESALPARELGLPDDGMKSAEFRRPVRTVIAAGDEVYVIDDISGLTVTAADGRLASVALSPDVVRGWSGAVGYLRALGAEFGWDAAQLDTLDAELAEFNRSGEGDTFEASIGPGTIAGAEVTGHLVFHRAGGMTPVTIEFTPSG